MWKKIKFKRGIISLLLVAGLILTNLNPLGALAEEVISGIQQMTEGLQTEEIGEPEENMPEDELEQEEQTSSIEITSSDKIGEEQEEDSSDKISSSAVTQEEVDSVIKEAGVNTGERDELGDDETHRIVEKTIEQGNKVIGEGDPVDPNKDIALKSTIKIRLKPAKEGGPFVKPGGQVKVVLGKNIKHIGNSNELEAYDKNNPGTKLADLSIKAEGEELVSYITLVNDQTALGSGTYVSIELKLGLKVDKATNPGGGSSDKKVWILDKEHNIEDESGQTLKMEKSGQVDWNAGTIGWIVKIKKTAKNGDDSLAGYQFSDNLKNVGKYVTDSFEVKNVSGAKVPGCNPEYAGDILTCIFPNGTPNEVIVQFKTEIKTDVSNSELMGGFEGVGPSGEKLNNQKYNKAILYSKDSSGSYVNEETYADARVDGNTYWGSKYPGKEFEGKYKGQPMYESSTGQVSYEGRYYREGGYYHVDWSIIFDATDKNLHNVKITDELPWDNQNSARMLFNGATLYVWDAVAKDWKTKPEYKFTAETNKKIYDLKSIDPDLSPLNTAVKLVINSKVEESKVSARLRFTNRPKISWGDGDTKIDNINSDVELAEDLLRISKKIEKDVQEVINGQKKEYFVKSNPEWTIHVDNEYITEGNTYIYDAVIYHESIVKKNVSDDAERAKFRVGDNKADNINGLPLTKILGRNLTRSVYEENSFNGTNKWGIKLRTHKLYYENTEVGTVLEFYNFKPEKDSNNEVIKTIKGSDGRVRKYTQDISFRTKLVDKVILLSGGNYLNSAVIHKKESGGNKFALADFWAKYSAKVIKKQSVASDVSISITNGSRNADRINIGKAADNRETAYNNNDGSILYRLSVNGSNFTTEGVEKQLRKIELRDIMPVGWKFDKIDADNDFLIYKGESEESNASKESYVRAIGEPLNEAQRKEIIESFSITKEKDINDVSKDVNVATFKFKKLDASYVILLRVKIDSAQGMSVNKYENVTNFARVYINAESYREMNAESKCEVKYDTRFLRKEHSGSPSDSKLKWIIKYDPSGMSVSDQEFVKKANDVKLVDTLGMKLKLLRKADGSLAYNGSSYRLTEILKDGTVKTYNDAAGLTNFLSAKTLSDGRDELTFTIPKNGRENIYVLEYTTQLMGGAGTTFSNKVRLEADHKTDIGESESNYKIVDASASGSVGADYTNIFIRKITTQGAVLTGATFKLTKKGDNNFIRHASTNDKGIASFYKLHEGEYVLEEITAPNGFFKDKTKYSFKIEKLGGNAGYTINDLNPKQGKVSISKDNPTNTIDFVNYTPDEMTTDFTILKAPESMKLNLKGVEESELKNALSGKLITGVEFTLTREDSGEIIKAEEGTGENIGTYTFRNLKKGTYILKETKNNEAYKPLTETYRVLVDPTKDAGERIIIKDMNGKVIEGDGKWIRKRGDTAIVFNEKKIILYDLKLIKADLIDEKAGNLAGIKNRLDGAEFILTDASGNLVRTAKTGVSPAKKGELIFTGLKAGTYTLTETKPPSGYTSLMKPYKVTITPTTGKDCKVTVEKMQPGQINVIENTIVVFNDKLYDITLIKADLIDKAAKNLNDIKNRLGGAKFRLQSVDRPSEIYIAETATDGALKGILTFTGIRSGKYILEEIKAPEGYSLLADRYEISVIRDSAGGFKVQITKADKNPDRVKIIEDKIAVFDERVYEFTLIKTDIIDNAATSLYGIKNRLDGAEFTLSWKLSNGGNVVVRKKTETDINTGEKGILRFSGLTAGVYTLKETEPPKGYAPLNKEFEITITPGLVNTKPVIKVTSGASADIKVFGGTVVLFNEKVYDLNLVKADIIDKVKIEAPGATLSAIESRLNGAGFRLISDSAPTVSESAVTVGGKLSFKGLKKGKYTLKEEVPPPGYNRLIEEFKITVNPYAAQGKEVTIMNELGNRDKLRFFDNTIVVFNEMLQTTFNLNLIKADLADKDANGLDKFKYPLLDGAKFRLSSKVNPAVSQSSVTANGGKLTFNGVDAGVYILKEIEAPANYAALADEYEVTVTPSAVTGSRVAIKNANSNHIKIIGDTIVVFNERVYDINLVKADLDANKDIVTKSGVTLGAVKALLDGARFRLTLKSDPKVTFVAVTGMPPATTGSLKFKGIKSGVYTLIEESAPAGYSSLIKNYEIIVTATAIKTEFEIVAPKDGEIKRVEDTVVVFNKKNPTPPPTTPPTPPVIPPGPVVPNEPGNPPPTPPTPNNPPTPTPNNPPPPTPNNPPTNITPNPGNPDEFVSVDKDKTPKGKSVNGKKSKEKDEHINIDKDKTPKGVNKPKLPKAGGQSTVMYYAGGAILLLLAAGIVVIKKKRDNK